MDEMHSSGSTGYRDRPSDRLYSAAERFEVMQCFLYELPPERLDHLNEVCEEAGSSDKWLVTKIQPERNLEMLWRQAESLGAIGIISLADPDVPMVCIDPKVSKGLIVGSWVDVRPLLMWSQRLLDAIVADRRVTLVDMPSDQGLCSQLSEVPTGDSFLCVGKSDCYGSDEGEDDDSDDDDEGEGDLNEVDRPGQVTMALGFTNFCGRRTDVTYEQGMLTSEESRCWSLNNCQDCKLEDRRAWVAYMLGVIDGVELHSLVVTDAEYRARVKLITKAGMSYLAIDQGLDWLVIVSGPVSIGRGSKRQMLSDPVADPWRTLVQAFENEPKSGDRIRTSRAWSRGDVVRDSEQSAMELVEPPSGWQWSKDLSKAERRRLMRSIGVSMDTRSARSTTPVTLEQWGQAVANGWVVKKRKRPSGPRQPAPDRRASRSASMIVLAEYARKKRSA